MATVPEQKNWPIQLTTVAATLIYTYPFLILDEEDLEVFLTPVGQTPDPVADLLTLNVNYTVTGVGADAGGTVVLIADPGNNATLTLSRNTPIDRQTDFSVGGEFTAAAVNLEFDRQITIDQEIEASLENQGLTYQTTDALEDNRLDNILPPLARNSAGIINIWSKASGGGLVNLELTSADDVNTLRSELASQTTGADGALLVGYFDASSGGITLKAKLDELDATSVNFSDNASHASCGATNVGYNAQSSPTNVRDELDVLGNSRVVPLVATLSGSAYSASTGVDIFPFVAYDENSVYRIKFTSAPPGAVTLNINSIGVKSLKDSAGNALPLNYFAANDSQLVYYNLGADEFRIFSVAAVLVDDWASKAEVQADSAVQKGVYLVNVKDHPGTAKAWVRFKANFGTTITLLNSYNVTSVVAAFLDEAIVNLSITMGNSNYVLLIKPIAADFNRTTTSFELSGIAYNDTIYEIMIFGNTAV